jgi:hypothetical protein
MVGLCGFVAYASRHSDVRLIGGRFMEICQAMGTPKGRKTGARYLREFVEEMKASGFVADALKRSGHTDAAVVPAESACARQTRAVLWRTVPCAVRAHFWSLPSPVPVVAAAGAPAGASPV